MQLFNSILLAVAALPLLALAAPTAEPAPVPGAVEYPVPQTYCRKPSFYHGGPGAKGNCANSSYEFCYRTATDTTTPDKCPQRQFIQCWRVFPGDPQQDATIACYNWSGGF